MRHQYRRRRQAAAERPRPERRAHGDHATETVGPQQGRLPRNRGADIVAGNHRLLLAERVEETHDVTDVMEDRVLLHLLGTVASPVAAQIESYRTETGIRERGQLVPP